MSLIEENFVLLWEKVLIFSFTDAIFCVLLKKTNFPSNNHAILFFKLKFLNH